MDSKKSYDDEFARLGARKDFEDKYPQKKSRIWRFLNSSFGLFILSSIVVGGLSFAYTAWKDYTKSNEEKRIENKIKNHTLRMLTDEAIYRLDALYKLKIGAREFESKNVYLAIWGNGIRDTKELGIKYYNRVGLFSEFENMSLYEVMSKLNFYVNNESQSVINDFLIELSKNENKIVKQEHLKTRTDQGKFLPIGFLDFKNRLYTTIDGDTITLSKKDFPLVRYYYAVENIDGFFMTIEKLKLSLTKNIVHLADSVKNEDNSNK